MTRVVRGFKLRRRHKKVLKLASGFRGSRSRLYRSALPCVRRALCFAYRDRKVKKRNLRSLWIQRINAATRAHGVPYSKFIQNIQKAGLLIDRKQLAEMCVNDKVGFDNIVRAACF